MHIAFNGWFWDRPDTGSGQYTRHIIAALRNLIPELRITLILPRHITAGEALPDDVNIIHTTAPLGGHLGKIWFEQVTAPKAAASAGADLIHIPYWAPPLSSPIPMVTTIHDVITLSMPVYQGNALARLYTSLVTAGARGAAHILTDSHASRQEINEMLDIPEDRITTAWLAVGEQFHPKTGREHDLIVREKYDLPERFVLYLGGFDIRKNVHSLLLAYTYVGQAMAEDAPLVLAGRPPRIWGTERFPDLPRYIEELQIGDYVRWLGEIDEEDKPSLYRLAEVMAFPSRYEGFGLPPLEAMACGTPLVACNASSIPEIVGDAGFLVDPDDARGLAGAILGVLLQPPLANQLRNLGLGRATQFNWRKTAEITASVYQQILSST